MRKKKGRTVRAYCGLDLPDQPYTYHEDKQENVFGLSLAVQEFRFSGEEKGLTKYGHTIEFDWAVIDRNTPTGASTNPKNFDLNKNLTMNLI